MNIDSTYFAGNLLNNYLTRRAGALVQWLKQPAWKVGGCGFEPDSALQVSKKQNGSCPLTRNDSLSWRTSVTEK